MKILEQIDDKTRIIYSKIWLPFGFSFPIIEIQVKKWWGWNSEHYIFVDNWKSNTKEEIRDYLIKKLEAKSLKKESGNEIIDRIYNFK